MRLTINITTGCILACGLLSAAPPPCITGTLASYIALGAEGCTFDGNVFANFTYSANASGGASKITPEEITLAPALFAPETTKLDFSAPWSVGADQTQESVISYTVVPPSTDTHPAQLDLTLGAVHIGGVIGGVTVKESTNVGTLNVYDRCTEVCQTKANGSLKFNPVSVLLIADHVSINGATGGASLKDFAAEVNLCYLCP